MSYYCTLKLTLGGITGISSAGSHRCREPASCAATPASATGSSRRRCYSDEPWWRGACRGCGRATSWRFWAACCRCDRRTTRCRPTGTAGRPSPTHPGPLCCSQSPCRIYPLHRQHLQPGTAKMTQVLNTRVGNELMTTKLNQA